MHSVNGRNTYSGTSWATAFQTITHALTQASSGDTIEIAGGPYRYDPNATYVNPESFPIRAPGALADITLKGRGEPVINAYYETAIPGVYADAPVGVVYVDDAAPCLAVQDGWTVEGLTFENQKYNKDVTTNDFRAIGIYVLDLRVPGSPSATATVHIEDCVFDDNFTGLWVRDLDPTLANETRVVDVVDCSFMDHGPVLAGPDATDRGHQGILTNNYASMTINVTDCSFENDHDGIESANFTPEEAGVVATGCYFETVENGFEMSDGIVEVTDCTFERCQAKDPNFGGVGSNTPGEAWSAGFALRGAPTSPAGSAARLRNNFFDRCQLAVWASAEFDVIDLGTALSGSERGNNTFTIDTQSPWDDPSTPEKQIYNISYVCVFSTSQTQVDAMGNTWTYDDTYGSILALNQGCDQNGSYDSMVAGPYPPGMPVQGVFRDANGVNIQTNPSNPCASGNPCNWGDKPQFRMVYPNTGNRPWNVATGQQPIQSCSGNPCAGMVSPSIKVR